MREKYNVGDSYKVFLWALLLPQVVSFLLVLIFSANKGQQQLIENYFYIFCMTMVAQVCFLLILARYNKKNNINTFIATKIKTKFNPKNAFFCVLISIIAVSGFINFIALFEKVLFNFGFSGDSVSLPLNSPLWLIVNIMVSAIVPAVMEEFIFRGVIFNGLEKKSFWFACLVSSLCFTIVHLSIYSLIYPFVMGIIFCLILRKTGSILYTMIAHFCNNLIVIIINYIRVVKGVDFGVLNVNTWWGGLLVSVVAILAFVTIYLIIKVFMDAGKNHKTNVIDLNNDGDNQLVVISGNNKNEKMLALSILIGVVFWIMIFVLTYFVGV